MTRHVMGPDGTLTDTSGTVVMADVIESARLHVPHLAPHILTVDLPKGDRVNILVEYSCHCWTRTFDATEHAGEMQIMDGTRPRAFCPLRFAASVDLATLLGTLPQNRLYLTPSDRNYGTYNATIAYSGMIRPPVPITSAHPFRSDPPGDSGASAHPLLACFALL